MNRPLHCFTLAILSLLLSTSQAMDGFLIVLDKEANVLYVSETITDYVGFNQVSASNTK